MTTLSPAAQAILEALSSPGLDDQRRNALALALQAVLAQPIPPTQGSNSGPAATVDQGAVRPAAVQRATRKAESVRFGKESVNALELPESGERYVYDTECPQLAVRLRPGGKTYLVILWDNQRKRTVKSTLGKVERLTPEQARKKAQALVASVGDGVDARRPAIGPMTLGELIDKWYAEKSGNVRTAAELKVKALHYLGRLAHRQASEVKLEDIGAIHTHIATEARKRIRKRVNGEVQWVEHGEPGLAATADKWRATINAVYVWGQRKGLVSSNPAAGIEAAFDAKGAERTNYLRGDELLRFWKAMLADHDADTRDVFQLLLHTAQRRGNVLAMRWRDIDLEHGIWTLGADETKQRKAQSTPLNAHAREIIARRHLDAGTEWVFPAARVRRDKPNGELGSMNEARLRDAWTRICAAAEIKNLRIHDLRHTAGSWLARLGSNEAIRQKALGHQTPAMAARYSHLELDPVADAMQRMGDAITAAATKQAATVRKFKKEGAK